MPELKIPYANTYLTAQTLENFRYTFLEPAKVKEVTDLGQEINRALDNPIGPCSFNNLKGAKSVAIVVSDISRPVPNKAILPPILERLAALNIQKDQICILIAGGLHQPATPREIELILGPELAKSLRIICHDAKNDSELTYLGTSSRNTPIYINKHYVACDARILVGMIDPHQFEGYTGGAKNLTIGLGGKALIQANHAMLQYPSARMGIVEGNPAREDVDEIGGIVGIDFIVNVVLNNQKKVVKAVAGHYLEAHRYGVSCARKIAEVQLSEPGDVVIASPGGFPKDANLYQAQKALYHAGVAVKPGGTIILVAEGSEGSGDNLFEETMRGATTPLEVIKNFESGEFRMGAHKAYLWAKTCAKARVILVSRYLKPEIARLMQVELMPSLDQAINEATQNLTQDSHVVVMPKASSTIPMI